MYCENRVRYFQSPEYDLYGRRLTYGNNIAYDPQTRITIPRATTQSGFREVFNTEIDASSPTTIAVNMPPDEDAVDRVANEFRFLDERPLGSSLAETERSTRHGSHDLLNSRVHSDRRTRKQFTFCLFACFLQLSIALGLLAIGGFRFRRIFERSSRFADFDNPQGKEVSNESASLASILSGSSWFVPSLLHIIAAITASWPILPNFSSTLQVANEFRFLDERPLGSSLAETERSTRHGSHDLLNSRVHSDRRTRKQFTFCLFACFLQLSIALGLLAFGGFRFRRIFERSSRFADFDNPQGKEVSNESASLASILSGSSWFVPSLLHIIAAITASWPILPNFSSTLQTLYIIFSSFAIIFWFNGIFTTAFELNVYYVQINEYQNTFTFRTLVVLFILASINVLIVPTLGIVYAAFEHTSSAPQKRSLFHSIATLFSILFSATPLFLAVPCLFFTAQNLRQWSSLNNPILFHLFGLRELVVSAYSLIVSVIGFAITLTTSRRLRFGVVILYSVSLLVILVYLVNGERIFSIVENFRALEATHLDSTLIPVTSVLMCMHGTKTDFFLLARPPFLENNNDFLIFMACKF
ncbi:hypothetical protein Tcan_18054 [Toxocara canis]|uniref:Transmembrane protein n=1 Tax=Toxocara canis TaxID=6265 RepID=A0A0B2VBS3_TOXCA|nr:hypothetical protein Tcan_18054 [Toxocara canis]